MIITLQDLMAVSVGNGRFCRRGCRKLCQRYGFSWGDFLENGIDADRLTAIDDAMVRRVVDEAKRRRG